MKKQILALLMPALVLLFTRESDAAILAQYNFNTGFSPSAADTNVAATDFILNQPNYMGRSSGGQNLYYRLTNAAATPGTGISTTASAALIRGDYTVFTLSATSGFHLNLDQIQFNYGGSAGTAGATAANFTSHLFLTASIDGGITFSPLGLNYAYSVSPGAAAANTPNSATIDLSSPTFQNLDSFVIRIYAYADNLTNPTIGSSADTVRLDNFEITGAAMAVPEPSALALFAMAITAAIFAFRFSQKNRPAPVR